MLRDPGVVREPDLDVRSLFTRGWRVFKEHMGLMIAVFILYSLLTGGGVLWDRSGWFFDFGQILMYAIAGPVTAGVYMFALRLIRDEEPDLGEMFLGFREFGRSFGVFVLYSVMMIVGFALLVAPGVYVAVALMPAMFLVLDDDLGVIDTLQKAWAMTEGHRGAIFLVALALVGLNLLGLAFFIVGIVFTGALSLLIGAAMYDELARAYEK
ncbi:MAG: hypothetical protein WD021_10275 [Rhodothermales bacterium]